MTDQRTLADRSREASNNKALSIGEAWNLLGEAADAIEQADARIVELQAQLGRDRSLDVAMRYETYGRLEARLRKAERLAEAVTRATMAINGLQYHSWDEGLSGERVHRELLLDAQLGLYEALAAFRTTEDAK